MDISKRLDELSDQFNRYPDQAREVGLRFFLNITGPGGRTWIIMATQHMGFGAYRTQGDPGGYDFAITIAAEDFPFLVMSDEAARQLVINGKLKIEVGQDAQPAARREAGQDIQIVEKLSALFHLGGGRANKSPVHL